MNISKAGSAKRTRRTISVLILFIVVFGARILWAQAPADVTATGGEATIDAPTEVRILAGRSTLIDTGAAITRVSLTSAEVADALVTASSQLLVHGKVPGVISMFVWNRAGAVRRYEVMVQRDIAKVEAQLRQLFPGENFTVQSNGSKIVVSGRVSTKEVADRVVDVAAGFVEKREEVIALMQVQPAAATDQVLLRVRFAEINRSVLTETGLSIFTSPTGVKNTIGRVTTQQFPAPGFDGLKYSKDSADFGAEVTGAEGKFTFSDFLNLFLFSEKFDLGLMIKALQQRGLFESLAEPNLVAESGKEASFLAGGEFPIPVMQGAGANLGISVMFKEFGIRLNFTPTVLGEGRVRLKVKPEVSALDFSNAIVLSGFRIPALSTRRAETELELRDGQTFAIAGLLNNRMNSTMQKIPGIGDIPILGHLFRSKASQKDRTELVVMITPQILRAGSPGVTDALPKLGEPFLSPLTNDQGIAPPPPAFESTRP
jgi:pilus assembly protein CpaC